MKYLFILLLTLSFPTFAETLHWKDKSFNIQIPAGWKSINDFFGIPVTLMGPFNKKINARPVVQIIPTSQKAMSLSDKDVMTFDKNYASGRMKWLKQNNGNLEKIIPAKLNSMKDGSKMLSAGVDYNYSGKGYIVRTFYINCPKNLYNLKIFLHAGLSDYLNVAEEAVRSFSCAK